MTLLPFELRAGLMSKEAYAEARSEWMEKVRAKWKSAGRRSEVELAWVLWSSAYGAAVETEEEAREAVATMPRELSAAMDSGRWTPVDLNRGKTYVLAGKYEEARAPLKRASSHCGALSDPTTAVLSSLYYGMALEGAGDADGARAAYTNVLARWGKAKPRSVTAEKAKARLKGLENEKKKG